LSAATVNAAIRIRSSAGSADALALKNVGVLP
jgi:hypothetical protein